MSEERRPRRLQRHRSWACDWRSLVGSITLALGEAATCTITNDDSDATSLTVVKTIVNDNGGTVTDENAFGLRVDGLTVLHGMSNPWTPVPTPCPKMACPVTCPGAGAATATPMAVPSPWCWVRPPPAPSPMTIPIATSLTVVKTIVNDNGGTVTDENAFGLESRWPHSAARREQHV